ncbi:hypothetical protein EK904_003073 [Melospiza melodia maxima]|nr:hypothetical protein EK904_003073 [Melospiza melodia maxima]
MAGTGGHGQGRPSGFSKDSGIQQLTPGQENSSETHNVLSLTALQTQEEIRMPWLPGPCENDFRPRAQGSEEPAQRKTCAAANATCAGLIKGLTEDHVCPEHG